MSLKKIEQIKSRKWFSLWDILAFGVIIITAVILIISFTVGKDKSSLEGFYVSYRGEQVLTFEFGSTPRVLKEENVAVEEVSGGYKIRFYTDEKDGFNDIFVDIKNKTVGVTASNCSAHKDCVYTPELKYNSSTPIICTPHALTISPLKFYDNGVIG